MALPITNPPHGPSASPRPVAAGDSSRFPYAAYLNLGWPQGRPVR